MGQGLLARGAVLLVALGTAGPATAQQLVQHCRSGNACMNIEGVRACGTVSHCWFTLHRSGMIFTEPEGIAGGIRIPWRTVDLEPDAVMDCWKDVTPNARLTSGFPFRNNGVTPHNGIDVASDSGNYGWGAPVRSIGAGVVTEVGESPANGKFVRVEQGDGVQMTYIHLLDHMRADGRQSRKDDVVHVGMQLGRMNCSGNCGGDKDAPMYQHISQTHVHIQGREAGGRLIDVEEVYGGASCLATENDDHAGGGGGGGGQVGSPCTGTICNEIP